MALPAEKLSTPLLSVNAAIRRMDPTRTLFLRNRWAQDFRVRFAKLKQTIRRAVIDEDVFGLTPEFPPLVMETARTLKTPGRRAFAFPRSADKVQAFMGWLQEQEQAGLLEITTMPQLGQASEGSWTNRYISDSYQRGVIRARYELARAGYAAPSIEASGGLGMVMTLPFHVDRVGLLYTRTFSELKGITGAMDQVVSRTLAQGMADGDNPRLLAKKLVAAIDGKGAGELGMFDRIGRFIPAEQRAEMLARTETIRAFHQGNIQEMRNWGTIGIRVQAEWMTAGDGRVCQRCLQLQGKVYTLDEIDGMIPYHPNCRCIALPIEVAR